MRNKVIGLTSTLVISLLVTACSSDSSDDDSSTVKTGVFVDSPVANIAYKTETHEGFTNADGEFSYEAGETVTFSIGGIKLPSALATGTVTPLTLVGTTDSSDTSVINIARLLQSLDKDGNPDNGIEIDVTAHETAAAITDVDFANTDFDLDTNIVNLVANSGSTTSELVDGETALAHLDESLGNTGSKLTADYLSGKTFNVSNGESDMERLVFNADGTGSVKFAANEDNDYDTDDINAISTWSVTNGVLSFTEVSGDDDSYWDWVFTPTSISDTKLAYDISVTGIEDGEAVSASGSGSMTTSAPSTEEEESETPESEEPESEEPETEEPVSTLTSDFLSGKSFSVSNGESDMVRLVFNADGTGSVKFKANEDNDFDENDVNALGEWSVTNGVLSFTEVSGDGESSWNWVFTPTAVSDTEVTYEIAVTGMEDGEAVSGSGSGSMTVE